MIAQDYVMLIADNPGITSAEIRPKIEAIGPVDTIHVLRQIEGHVHVNLSIVIVKFHNSEDAYNAIHTDVKIPGVTIVEMDHFFLYPAVGVIYGLPKIDNLDYYSKIFTPLGAQSLRIHSPTSPLEPNILIVAFNDKNQMHTFKRSIAGLTIAGKHINIIPLRRTMTLIASSSFTYMSEVLSKPENRDLTIHHFENVYTCWSGAAYSLSTVLMEFIDKCKGKLEFDAPPVVGPFEYIEKYLCGIPFDITVQNAPFLLKMSELLGMTGLFNNCGAFLSNAVDPYSACALICGFDAVGLDSSTYSAILAGAFEDVKEYTTFNSLPASKLVEVISSPLFAPESETSLFRWVLGFASSSPAKFTELIKQVAIEHLEAPALLELMALPPQLVDLNAFRLSLAHLGQRAKFPGGVSLSAEHKSNEHFDSFHRRFVSSMYEFDGVDKLNGILKYFRTQQPFTPEGAPSVTVTASSVQHGSPDVLISGAMDEWFGTNDVCMSWVRITLNSGRASLTGYAIKTHNHPGNGHINNWRLSGSNNGTDWATLDVKEWQRCFNESGATEYFPLAQASKPFRYFELRQTRGNTMGYHCLRLGKIELFGSLQ